MNLLDKESISARMARIREMVAPCIQCGTCSGSCPNAFAMDHTPRRLWNMVLMERFEEIFESDTFYLCSSCYYCTLRCPRGLPLTDAMAALKQVAAMQGLGRYRRSDRFYRSFVESVRRHGRVREMEFMAQYFVSMKNPLIPLEFARLGTRLMLKGKLHLELPSPGRKILDPIFRKVEQMEGGS